MKRAMLYCAQPAHLAQVEAIIRRELPMLGPMLLATTDSEELVRWAMMHDVAALLIDREEEQAQRSALEALRGLRPQLQTMYLPAQILTRHPATEIFLRQVTQQLGDERAGFVGTTAIRSLIQLIQFIEYAQLSGLLGVQGEGELHTVGFERGQLVHARVAQVQGVDALAQLLELARGSFRWSAEASFERNVEAQAGERLLLELVRERDERRWREEGEALSEVSETLSAPPVEEAALLVVKTPAGERTKSGQAALQRSAPQRGFVGGMALGKLVDVVQLHALTQSTGVLHVYYGLREARIYLDRGEVVHAVSGRLEGESAFIMMMEVRHGSFMFEPCEVTHHTIRTSLLSLLLGQGGGEDEDEDDELWGGGDLDLFGGISTGKHKSLSERPASDVLQAPRELGDESSELMHRLEGAPGVSEALAGLSGVSGFLWTALVSVRHGVLYLDQAPGLSLVAAQVHGALRAMPALWGATLEAGEVLEDMMAITPTAYLLLRPLSQRRTTFVVLALTRRQSNLGMARLRLGAVEESLRALLQAEEASDER